MNQTESTGAILAFIAFAVPIVGALWKIFSVREELQSRITDGRHRLELIEQRIEHLVDQQELFLNGIKETLQHVRDRSLHAEEKLEERLGDLEIFIEKTTAFNRRRSG